MPHGRRPTAGCSTSSSATGRITNAELAERLHLSPSPCLRRLRALERDGVIAGYRAGWTASAPAWT